MKKGFTLIELLGVIVILSVILLVAVPATMNLLKKADEKAYDTFLENLYLAAETYVQLNRDAFPALIDSGDTSSVTISTLKSENLIKDLATNPQNSCTVILTDYITITVNPDLTLSYLLVQGSC